MEKNQQISQEEPETALFPDGLKSMLNIKTELKYNFSNNNWEFHKQDKKAPEIFNSCQQNSRPFERTCSQIRHNSTS